MNEHICVAVNTKATGEKIRKLREKCGFSKTEVQESLGLVGVQSIYDWENGVKNCPISKMHWVWHGSLG